MKKIIPECCKICENKGCYPDLFPCSKCYNVNKEPKHTDYPHDKKRHNK